MADVGVIVIGGLVLAGLVACIAVLRRANRSIKRSLTALRVELGQLESEVSQHGTFTSYLRRKERVTLVDQIDAVGKKIERLRAFGWLTDGGTKALLESSHNARTSLNRFFDKYVEEYSRHEIAQHRGFFDKTGLNEEQKIATVMRDGRNLVAAAAGSGKTRVLTARVALLVESGVPPENILALAYTRDAARVMEERLGQQFGIETAKVKTIHSFSRELARDSPNFRSGVATQSIQNKIIKSAAEKLSSQDRKFAVDLLTFAVDFRRAEEKRQEDFPDVRKYYEYLRRQEYEALNLKKVKSIAEREIANFLFLNDVEFEYETQASWADVNPDYRDYEPDFYLPDYNLWIEHWGIDRDGNVPKWFAAAPGMTASERYRGGMEWKKEQFKKHGRMLIETFQYQQKEGTLLPELKKQLETNGVTLREIAMDEILERINLLIHRDPFYELMFSFVSKAKNNGLSVSDVSARVLDGKAGWTRKQRSFASLMIPIWREYESELKERNMFDFSDMITTSLQVARKDGARLAERYPHVLIDEFQDITDPQLELVKCLTPDSGQENTLFCVGDHRQNIFSYAGSNIHNILDFDKHFPYPERTTLSTNYRCPKNVVDTSNAVVDAGIYRARPAVAASNAIHPIQLVQKMGRSQYEGWEKAKAKELLAELLSTKREDEDILVLARYNFCLGPLMLEFPDHEKQRLSFKTIHRAKGTEADYVLLLSCIGGLRGFPSKILEENLLDIVSNRRQTKDEKLEEERRLFYVALTRCRKQLYIFTSKSNRSKFISEISSYLSQAGQTEGVCIRCGRRTKFDTDLPLCFDCHSIWLMYKNRMYPEKYCHSCGKLAETSFAKPLCIDCYKRLNRY